MCVCVCVSILVSISPQLILHGTTTPVSLIYFVHIYDCMLEALSWLWNALFCTSIDCRLLIPLSQPVWGHKRLTTASV